ncbi:MAG: hypothetical protein D3924_10800 [Candidatus Electrothrix sp. AR4]|nr:hypothetical protein [Candidatus Electrothrix sp. AR4]
MILDVLRQIISTDEGGTYACALLTSDISAGRLPQACGSYLHIQYIHQPAGVIIPDHLRQCGVGIHPDVHVAEQPTR